MSGRDLMESAEVKAFVREAYRDAMGAIDVVCQIYSRSELDQLPRDAVDRSLGVANHLAHADLRVGDAVLDVGCGAGIDSILAARRVGPDGKVIALDFLPEMLARTAKNAAEAGVSNIETLEGEMESIPLPDASVDHIISNGVINLSPRKSRVFRECARVLRPGGRFTVSDLTIVEEELPTEVLLHPAAWAG